MIQTKSRQEEYRHDLFTGMLRQLEEVELREAEDNARATGNWRRVQRIREQITALKVFIGTGEGDNTAC